MKLLILLLLLPFAALAQPAGYIKRSTRDNVIATLSDSGAHVRAFNGAPYLRSGVWSGAGQFVVDSANHRPYFSSGGTFRRMAQFSEITPAITTDASLLYASPKISVKWWLNVQDYGAVGDSVTNNTAAFANCIAAAVALGNCQIRVPRGMYLVDSIAIPSGTSGNIFTIDFAGEATPSYLFGTVASSTVMPKYGSIIKSTSTTVQSLFRQKDLSSNFAFSNINITNLEFRTYDNPSINGVDLSYAANVSLEHVFINTGRYNVFATEPSHGTKGLITPISNNGARTILRDVAICGFHIGILAAEHTDGDIVNIYSCKNGIVVQNPFGPHGMEFGHLSMAGVKYGLVGNDMCDFSIKHWDIEHFDSATQDALGKLWMTTWADVYDPDNNLFGHIDHKIVGANGGPDTWIMVGAAHVKHRKVGHNYDQITIATDNKSNFIAPLDIEIENIDGGVTPAPSFNIQNTSNAIGGGGSSTGNLAFGDFKSGNGLVYGQIASNYGTVGAAPYTESGFFFGARTDQPLIFFNKTTGQHVAKFLTTGQARFPLYGSGTFTGTATGTLQVTSNGSIIEGSSEAPLTFTNGLTRTTNTIKWGGNLTGSTTINGSDANDILFDSMFLFRVKQNNKTRLSIGNSGSSMNSPNGVTKFLVEDGAHTLEGLVTGIVDTTGYKPLAADAGGGTVRMAYWPTGSGGGSGTVTSFTATDGSGFDFSVANSTTTPTLTLTTSLTSTHVPVIGSSGALTGSSNFTFTQTAANMLSLIGNNAARSSILVQNTNSSGNASFYFQNDRGSFNAYGGLLTGGSGDVGGPLLGLARADATFLFNDGANSAGLAVGTLGGTPFILGTNNAAAITINSSQAIRMHLYGSGYAKFDASGNITSVLEPAGSFSGVGTATTVFTVTFGGTMPNNTYKVNVTPTAVLSAALFYVTNKTTTTFDVTYMAGLTGTVTFDYKVSQ